MGRGCIVLFDVHALDEAVRDGVDVADLAIQENDTIEAFYELVNSDFCLAIFAVDHLERFHMRIELLPLAGPVGTNLFFANRAATFGCPGPTDVVAHELKDTVNVSLVELSVGPSYQGVRDCHESSGVPVVQVIAATQGLVKRAVVRKVPMS